MYTKKSFIETRQDITDMLLSPQMIQFYGQALHLGTMLSLSIYILVRLLFHDFPFEIMEETAFMLKILFTGWSMTAWCMGCLHLVFFIGGRIAARKKTAIISATIPVHDALSNTGIQLSESLFITTEGIQEIKENHSYTGKKNPESMKPLPVKDIA